MVYFEFFFFLGGNCSSCSSVGAIFIQTSHGRQIWLIKSEGHIFWGCASRWRPGNECCQEDTKCAISSSRSALLCFNFPHFDRALKRRECLYFTFYVIVKNCVIIDPRKRIIAQFKHAKLHPLQKIQIKEKKWFDPFFKVNSFRIKKWRIRKHYLPFHSALRRKLWGNQRDCYLKAFTQWMKPCRVTGGHDIVS